MLKYPSSHTTQTLFTPLEYHICAALLVDQTLSTHVFMFSGTKRTPLHINFVDNHITFTCLVVIRYTI